MVYWIINLLFIGMLSYLGFQAFKQSIPSWVYWGGLAMKFLAGIGVGLIFSHHYPSGDTFRFYDLANQLLERTDGSPWLIWWEQSETLSLEAQPRVFFFIRLLAFFLWMSGGSYWLASLYLSLLSFLGCCFAVRELMRCYPKDRWVIMVAFLLVPTVVFWSSGILKESITNPSFAILSVMAIKVYQARTLRSIDVLISFIALVLLFNVKHYLLIVFLLFAGSLFSMYYFRKLKGVKKWLIAFLILSGSLGLTQTIHPYLTLSRITQTLYENNHAINARTTEKVGLELTEPTIPAVVKLIPNALFTGLFRPSFMDSTPAWGIPHKLENFIALALTCLSLMLIFKNQLALDWRLWLSATFNMMFLATMLALSTPNLGSLVRYKTAFYPFLLILISSIPYHFFVGNQERS